MARLPEMHFGWGIRFQLLDALLNQYHDAKLVVVTGQFLSQDGEFGHFLVKKLAENHNQVLHFVVSGEPSPDLVDELVQQCDRQTDAVIGLGGGSVLDTAKAIAGLIPSQTSVMDYLEGVGKGQPFQGETVPFIAVPTTAGTGSETTKNAVLSRLGQFKKSFRHEKLLAQSVWLDPAFLPSVPPKTLYATAMDAFTQLLESYTTREANPITDALAWQGLTLFKGSLEILQNSEDDQKLQAAYEHLMLAASLSGITLANAGLGAVHGLAGPVGAFFVAPHGEVCARLLAPITQANIEALQQALQTGKHPAVPSAEQGAPLKAMDRQRLQLILEKYAQIGCLLAGEDLPQAQALKQLVEQLQKLTVQFVPEGLQQYGLTAENLTPILENCRSGSMLGNPLPLSDEALKQALLQAL
ncbi:iron-containing alcohol dehydrogenase [Galenea microaerophila]